MAKDYEVDDKGDWVVDPDTHDFVIIDGIDEIAQRIKATLETYYGEMEVLDPEQGMDYTSFLGKHWDKEISAKRLRETIEEQVPEVDSVDKIQFDVDKSNRHLKVHFEATATPTEETESEPVEGDVEIGI